MTRREVAIVTLAALAGFVGGTASNAILPVHAQERKWPKVLTAEKILVVDPSGAKRVKLSVEDFGSGSVKIYNQGGGLAWSAPDMHVWPVGTSPDR